MDTRFWGPSGWRLLHMTVSTPLQDRKEEDLYNFFELLPYVLPCKFCRKSLSIYYEARPIPKSYRAMKLWLYEIHNDVNEKLRSQNLLKEPNPSFKEIEERYSKWVNMPCASTQMLGWDFLYSIANTTPCKSLKSSPLEGAPALVDTPELKNRWNTMNYKERIPYVEKWWKLIGKVLPFKPWRSAWEKNEKINGLIPVFKGKKAVLAWVYKMEHGICSSMSEEAPHGSFNGLCKEISTFASGCGSKTNPRVKTCRAKKNTARETLRKQRNLRYEQHGGVL